MHWLRRVEEATRFAIWFFFFAFSLIVATTSHMTGTSWGLIILFIITGGANVIYLTFRGYSKTRPGDGSTTVSLIVGASFGVLIGTADLLQAALVALWLSAGILLLRELSYRIYEFLAGLMNGGIGGAISSDREA